jgi:hypothetical protein
MSPAQAAALAGGVTVLLCWLFECWVDGRWSKNPTAGAALGAVLAVLFSIAFAGGREQPGPPPQPSEASP